MSGSVVIKKKPLIQTPLRGDGVFEGQVVQAHQGEQIMYSKRFVNRDIWPVTPIAIYVFDLVAPKSGSFWCH
jgi:hypothetical protein